MIVASIDHPQPLAEAAEEIAIRGWAFSDGGLITSALALCGGETQQLRLGLPRPDLPAACRDRCRNEFVGFEGRLRHPSPGSGDSLLLTLLFEDSEGDRLTRQIELQPRAPGADRLPRPFLQHLDLPLPDQPVCHILAVDGWVLSEGPPIDRALLVAGDQACELSLGWPRPDVVDHLGIADGFRPCGYRGFAVPRSCGALPFEIRFFSGSRLVETVRSQAWIEAADSTGLESHPTPQFHLSGTAARYVDLLVKSLNGSIGAHDLNRSDGRDWPEQAQTMLGLKRLGHLRSCVETVLQEGIEGDFIETGVWKGGSCILMRGILEAWGDARRSVWVADSFQGLPRPGKNGHPADEGDSHHAFPQLAIPLEQVKSNFRSYDLLDARVKFLPGWFCDTLPRAPVQKLAILRLDGDMYESTFDALVALYDKLQPGGFCIVDDYGGIPACRAAVHDFRRRRAITDPIHAIDWTGAYWRKQGPT